MDKTGTILLVSCYELGHQPFHLASLQAMLQEAGYMPTCVDTAIETLSDETIQRAQFVGIAVPMHTALRLGEQIARRIRRVNPSAHICFYGLYALLNVEHLLQDTIDSAIGGEYEGPLLCLVVSLAHDGNGTIPGVHTRAHKSEAWIQRTAFVQPQRQHLPPLDRYAHLQIDNMVKIAGYTETTRGCKHTCLHCPITPVYKGRFFAIPVNIVLADIRVQVAQGAQHITFGDPDFWNGPTHAMRIIRIMHEEFPDVTFDATIKIEHLLKHRHLLAEMKRCGCAFIVSAVESLNDVVLQHLDKGHSSEDVHEAFQVLSQADIALRPSLLPFSPWETLTSYLNLLEFFETQHFIEHLDMVHLSIRLLIPPGSALLNAPDKQLWLDELDAEAYTYRWHHPDPRMDALQQRVATIVTAAEEAKANIIETFFQVKAAALACQGQDFSICAAIEQYGTCKVLPHLTESWFC